MEPEQTPNPEQNTTEPIKPTDIPIEQTKEVVNDIPSTQPEQNDTKEIETHPKPEIISQKYKWTITEKIAAWGLFVNIILGVVTYLLFNQATKANQVANDALKTTQESVNEAKRANDIAAANLVLAQKQAASNDSISDANFNLSKQSVDAQIGSLNTSQKQFEISNMPYLECKEFIFLEFEGDKKPIIQFYILNFGRSTAKIINFKIGFFYKTEAPSDPTEILNTLERDPTPTGMYISNEYPTKQIFTANQILTKQNYDAAINKKLIMFFCGEITYINEANKKKRMYRFNALIYPPPSTQFKIVYVENKDIN